MNRIARIVLVIILIATGENLAAQQKAKSKAADKWEHVPQENATASNILYPTVYLGRSEFHGGSIKKQEFDRLLKQGLTSHDSLGNKYKVMGFDFNYIERQLAEDSIGNMKVFTEVFYEYCPGDTITSNIATSLYERSKPGDTILIERVKVARYVNKTKVLPDATAIAAKGLKCVIVK
jgi:hypothetical protein